MDLLVTKLCASPGSPEPFSKTNPTTPFSGSAALTLDSPSMGILELLPALGRTGAFMSLKMGFLWVFLGFSQGFLHIPRNFPTTTSRSKFPPVTPQINWDCLIGFYAVLRGETLISQASPWKPRIPKPEQGTHQFIPMGWYQISTAARNGRREESSRALLARRARPGN